MAAARTMMASVIVGDRFEVVREAGSGGMGVVYQARDRVTGGIVAVKVLGDRSNELRFARESELLAQLDHPGIVSYVAHGGRSQDAAPYLAMEWLEGEDLASRLQRGRLSIDEAVALLIRVADAVGVAHARGIIHRDLKPSNVFLVGGHVDGAKVLDFGLAREARATEPRPLTATGAVMGSVGYLAPEQARGSSALDARCDVFALGCILFECLTGQAAFGGGHAVAVLAKLLVEDAPRVRPLRPDVPSALDALVARMLERNPEHRPADASVVRDALLRISDASSTASLRPRSVLPAALTRDEQRMMAVILVGERRGSGDTIDDEPGTSSGAATMVALRTPEARAGIDAAIEPFAAAADVAADGTVVVTLQGGVGTDQAARAARCALALRQVCPGAVIALALGRGVQGGGPVAGEVIDSAASLLASALSDRSDAVHVEPGVVPLLETRFVVARGSSGMLLHAERSALESARVLLGRVTPFVGRAREMTMLEQTFASAVVEREAAAVVVIGDAGSGKSRLREEVVRAARRREPNVTVWFAQGDALRTQSAFAVAAPMVRAACAIDDTRPTAAQQEAIVSRVAETIASPGERERVACFLAEMVGCPFDATGNVLLRSARESRQLMHDQITRAWVDFVGGAASLGPLLVVLDDLHWVDPPTIRLFDAALTAHREMPWMVVALGRPEALESFPALWRAHGAPTMHLAPLAARAAEKLVRQALPAPVDDQLVAALVERASGNPFVLEELVRAYAQRQRGDEALPTGVLALVQARLETLGASLRRVLRAASIFGRNAREEGVARLLGDEDAIDLVRSALSALVQREVLEGVGERSGVFRFRHDLLRDAAYAMLTASDRRVGHALAGEWLEASGEQDASVLAKHFDLGGDVARASAQYARAAGQALEGDDLEATIAHASRALELGAVGEHRGRALYARAVATRFRGDCKAGLEDARAAISELEPASAPWFSAILESATLGDVVGERGPVRALVDLASSVKPRDAATRALWVRVLGEGANSAYHGGDDAAGDALMRRIEQESASVEGDPLVEAAVHRMRATRAAQSGDHGAELLHWMRATECHAKAGNRRGFAIASGNLGYCWMMMGGYAEAEAALRQALATARAMRLARAVAGAKHNLGLVLAYRGDFASAIQEEKEALDAMSAAGDERVTVGCRIYLAHILEMAGDLEAAEGEARQAVRDADHLPHTRPQALAILARVCLRRGATEEALRLAAEGIEMSRTGYVEEGGGLLQLAFVEALFASGHLERGKAALREAKAAIDRAAAAIGDPALRGQFLAGVENARTLALARDNDVS